MRNRNYPMNPEDEHSYISWQKSHRRGKIAGGLIIVTFGVIYLLQSLGIKIDDWVISPGTILMGIGAVVLIRHKFKKLFGYFLLIIGQLLLIHEWYPNSVNADIIWPVVIILAGLVMIFKKRDRHHHHHHHHPRFRRDWEKHKAFFEKAEELNNIEQDDFIDAVSIFGGIHKNVVSKQFRGADIVTIFGGNELNLSQADFTDKVVLDITNIFGGTTLIIPNNWQLKSEMVTIFGGIEDKRPVMPPQPEGFEKVIILRGTCMFGGIDINSFS